MMWRAWIHAVVGLAAAPLLGGIIVRIKARMAGRQGQPLLQAYYELWKLLQKGVVYSATSTWVLRAAPAMIVGAMMVAVLMLPFGGMRGVIAFDGDVVVFVMLLGLARVLTALSALDTGSSFEGMGASREMLLGVISEPALFIALGVMTRQTEHCRLAEICAVARSGAWAGQWPVLALVLAVMSVLMVIETARVPVDDPATHLELTMIHEVMVLDHSGPELGLMQYAHALKMWVWGVLCVNMVMPAWGGWWQDTLAGLAGIVVVACGIGLVESSMARWRMTKLPQLAAGAAALGLLALLIDLWRD